MKKAIFILLILIILTYLTAQEFEINKLGEIAYAQGSKDSESIQVVDNYLYYSSQNGLEIYEINVDGSINKLSVLTIARSGSMIIKDQYCFLTSGSYDSANLIPGYNLTIYKIDISDVNNPIIVDQIEYPELNYYGSMNKFGDYLIFDWFDLSNNYNFYSIPEMEYVGQIISDFHHIVVNDNLLLRQDGLTFYIEQYNPPDEFEVIGVIDVSAYSDGNYPFDHFKVINDTILSAVNFRNITFWDISDITNWQYLSRYTLPENINMSGNKQYVITDENAIIFDSYLLRLLDISDISNPILVDSIEHNMESSGQACDYYSDNIYVGTFNDGIQHYKIENNTVEYVDSYYEHIRFFIGDIYENKLIISTVIGNYYLFDLEDPINSVELGEWFNEIQFLIIHKQGGWMVLKNFEEYTFEIYDISDLENPILSNSLSMTNYGCPWTFCFIDESDPNSFYLCNYLTNTFWKFDISESGEPVQLFEYLLPSTPEGIAIINSIAYATYGEDIYNLLVINGLNENEPYIANEIYNFTENKYLDNQEGYLTTIAQYASSSTAQVFQLEDPLQPELYFTPPWGERIEIEGNLIFAKLNHIVGVYENRPNCTEPIAIFNGLNSIYSINLIEHEGINYLITNEMANIGLFEYTYVPSSAEDELPKPKFTLSNYPNPFNPETTIQFNLIADCDVQIDIYNIKGQKINSIVNEQFLKGEHTIIWNGEDESGKTVSSGVYLYKLKVNGRVETVKKCMLLK